MNNEYEIIKEPELYIPEFNNGIYENYIPKDLNSGYKCGCGARKDHVFKNETNFRKHFKTKKHESWLQKLNENKINYYNYYIENEKIIKTLKIIINQKDKELNKKQIELKIKNKEIKELNIQLQTYINPCDFDLLSF
tara:strand:+ start:91 stop:501 length:411 start_codon:yes stop_codon:yes gene_type:complete